MDVAGRADADLGGVTASLRAWGEVLARVVDAAPPGERGWHHDGTPDAAGFAALGDRPRGPAGATPADQLAVRRGAGRRTGLVPAG
ncbi:MAG: hypothetical protein JWR70_598 [Modestobacter sp.]|nr:hypothetical protein [Modestobacter sp.]